MSWSTIKTNEVLEQFTTVEQSTLAGIQGAADTLDGILARTVRAARGSIAAGGNQLDSTADSIPDQVRMDVIALARWQWLVSFPALKSMQTDGRKAAATNAQERLDKIADGKPKVELPATPIDTSVPTQSPSFGTTQLDTSSYAPDA